MNKLREIALGFGAMVALSLAISAFTDAERGFTIVFGAGAVCFVANAIDKWLMD